MGIYIKSNINVRKTPTSRTMNLKLCKFPRVQLTRFRLVQRQSATVTAHTCALSWHSPFNFGPGIFLSFVGSPREVLRFWFLQPFDHIQSTPHGLPVGVFTNLVQWRRDDVRGTSCPSILKLNWRFQSSFLSRETLINASVSFFLCCLQKEVIVLGVPSGDRGIWG